MKKVIIVGAGGFGREVYQWLLDIRKVDQTFEISGFIDDDPNEEVAFGRVPVLSTVKDYRPQADEYCVMAIGTPRIKRAVFLQLKDAGAKFMTAIHPTVIFGNNVSMGDGCVICPYSVLTCDIQLGDGVMINLHTTLGHDVRVGSYTTLSSHVDLTGHCELEEGVFMGSGARLIPSSKVGAWSTVGAGSCVTRMVKAGQTVYGVPARVISAER